MYMYKNTGIIIINVIVYYFWLIHKTHVHNEGDNDSTLIKRNTLIV